MKPRDKQDIPLRRFGLGRAAAVLFIVIAATFATLHSRVAADVSDLESAAAASTGLVVRPGSLAFVDTPAQRGAPRWREALMLASTKADQPADLYALSLRLTADGRALSVGRVHNLSSTPHADERDLVVEAPFAAVSAYALGQARALTVLDFRGGALSDEATWNRLTIALARLSNWLETGRLAGIGKTTLRFTRPPRAVAIKLDPSGRAMRLSWSDAVSGPASADIELERIEATAPPFMAVCVDTRLPKSPVLWTVDTVRSLPFVGPAPIEWLEGRFFAAKDAVHRFAWRHGLVSEEQPSAEAPAETRRVAAAKPIVIPKGLSVGAVDAAAAWPPAALGPPVFSRRAAGEGEWRPASPEFLRGSIAGDDVIYRTYLRTDSERPYVKVELFAMDMRRLELRTVAGLEDPEPTTGSQGTGVIPRDPDLLPRIVAAFNGAFKTLHGAYGMVAERDVLLPPKDDAATLASFDNGVAAMGSWPKSTPLPSALHSLRQNMDPLVENGAVNPRRRYLWGFTLDEDITAMNTIRSGVCMTGGGHLIYAWGEELSADTLATAMNAAGCVYGMHLDMNPFHTAFIYYKFQPLEPGQRPVFDAHLAIPAMRYSLQRYVFASPKDFFYLALKKQGLGPDWSADGLAQPAPADIPAVWRTTGDGCRVVAVDLKRARLLLTSGQAPAHLLPAPVRLPPGDAASLLVAARLRPYDATVGQIASAAAVAPMQDGAPTLALGADSELSLGPWAATRALTTSDAVQGNAPGATEGAVALGLVQERFLVLGEGPALAIESVMKELGATAWVTFATTQASPLLVRGPDGLMDLAGAPAATLDDSDVLLHVIAAPRPLGMQRLEALVETGRGPSQGASP